MTTGSILWFLAIGAFVYYMMKNGGGCCGGHDHGGHGKDTGHGEQDSHEKPALLNMEDQRINDPVCGMEVDEKDTTTMSTHLGRTFRFCSERCRKLFDLNPNKYIGHSHGTHQHS